MNYFKVFAKYKRAEIVIKNRPFIVSISVDKI